MKRLSQMICPSESCQHSWSYDDEGTWPNMLALLADRPKQPCPKCGTISEPNTFQIVESIEDLPASFQKDLQLAGELARPKNNLASLLSDFAALEGNLDEVSAKDHEARLEGYRRLYTAYSMYRMAGEHEAATRLKAILDDPAFPGRPPEKDFWWTKQVILEILLAKHEAARAELRANPAQTGKDETA